MKRTALFTTWLCLFAANSFAVDPSDSLRARYVQRFPDYFFLWPVVKQRSTTFDIQNVSAKNNKLTYKPNGNYGLGLGMYIFEIGFEVVFSIQPKVTTQPIYGHTTSSDLQANILGKHWGFDLFTQHYKGFYVSDLNKAVPTGSPYPQRPDISTWNTGVNGIYLFNKKKYSIRAAYNFSEKQLRSAGSFLLSGTLNTFSLRADSAVYGPSYEPTLGVNADFKKLDYTTISISPGYAHTFVLGNFFVNGSLSVGPANHWVYYQSATVAKHDITLNSFIDLRLSVGYNSDRFFTGISFVAQARNIKFEQVQFTNTNTTFKVVMGYRFREFGVLKKSARDFLPINKKSRQ